MAILARGSLVQEGQPHPQNLRSAIFQPINLLVSTLGIATAIVLPLRNADALEWAQVQHPSHLSGYLNPDTSRGTPKTLLAELRPPSGNNGLLQSVSTPAPVRSVVNTSQGTALVLTTLPSPIVPGPHLAPVRFWFQPANTSAGMAKVLYADATPPNFNYQHTAPDRIRPVVDTSAGTAKSLLDFSSPFTQKNWANTPEPLRLVPDTTRGTSSALFVVPPPPFVVAPHCSPVQFWFQPQDSSVGMAKVLFDDATPSVTPEIDRGVRRRRKPLPAFLAPAPRPPEEAPPPPVVEIEIPVEQTPEAPLLAEAIARSLEPPPIIAAQISLPPALKTKPRKAVDVIDDDDDEILMMM